MRFLAHIPQGYFSGNEAIIEITDQTMMTFWYLLMDVICGESFFKYQDTCLMYPVRHWILMWHIWNSLILDLVLNKLCQHRMIAHINTLRPGQNGRCFADDISVNKTVWISIKISLKFVPGVSINNIPASVQMMAWCQSGDTPLSELMIA